MLKATYGTGCFALLNTGTTCVKSQHRLLSTVAHQLDGKMTYALEGSIFVAGAVVQWLRDGLKVIRHASETEALANQAKSETHVYLFLRLPDLVLRIGIASVVARYVI